MDENKDKTMELEVISVKEQLKDYVEFKAGVPVYQFYGKGISDTITKSSACDVDGQIDMEDGTKVVRIDKVTIEIKHDGKTLKDFTKPVEPKIDYSMDISYSIDHQNFCDSYNLKELEIYMKKAQYGSTIYSVIFTDGKKYMLLQIYDERNRYDKRDELLWTVILACERNYFVDREYIQYVESHERLNSSSGSFISLFGSMGGGTKSLNSTKIIKNGYEELEKLIGLDTIKNDIKDLASFFKMQKKRKEKGMKIVPMSLHLVFTGNPGTGKTTVARILASIYKEIGALSKGHVVEVDRADLVAEYVGQTAPKTSKKIQEAMGGILFIDEAYTLAKGDGKDFGQEAIDTLLKAMEDHRENFIVIVAGYPAQMHTFINSNPGLKSRFNKYINFPDYSAKELRQIFMEMCDEYEYHLTPEAEDKVRERIEYIESHKKDNFANARTIRNLFEKIITRQAARLGDVEDENADLSEINAEDVNIDASNRPVKTEKGNFHVVE